MKKQTTPSRLARRLRLAVIVTFLLSSLSTTSYYLMSPPRVQGVVSPNVVISQVYGGGGNAGATFTHDFIELFNRGNTTVSLAGWSVQYTSAAGTGNLGSATNLI